MFLLLQTSSTFQFYILSICKWPFQLISVILLVNNNNGYFFFSNHKMLFEIFFFKFIVWSVWPTSQTLIKWQTLRVTSWLESCKLFSTSLYNGLGDFVLALKFSWTWNVCLCVRERECISNLTVHFFVRLKMLNDLNILVNFFSRCILWAKKQYCWY